MFNPGDRVIYVPLHAKDDINHADCERGSVSSVRGSSIFVKFDDQVSRFGLDGTTAQYCDAINLKKEPVE